MKPIISIQGISKRYSIGEKASYGSFREEVMDALASPFRRVFKGGARREEPTVWAIKDVSFDVNEGDVVGIVGRNGAGKSTLLKILSRITEPTEGRIVMRGRIASLLEVGTGFHPELTGRENIFLNGALLGMTAKEIKSKFDEIVAFSEIEKFLDTPVKRYSSGMYVRLAFAVAAHLEPEILVIDEVLAVGDSIFQKKCIDKMLEVSGKGRTVIFVSHNFSALKALCQRAVLLESGKLAFSGGVDETIDIYTDKGACLSGKEMDLSEVERQGRVYPGELAFDMLTFIDHPVKFGAPIRFRVKLKSTGGRTAFHDLDFGVAIRDKNNNTVVHCSNRFISLNFDHVSDNDEYLFEIENILRPDIYSLTLFLRCGEVIQDWISNMIKFEVQDGNPYDFTDTKQIQGMILPGFDITQQRSN